MFGLATRKELEALRRTMVRMAHDLTVARLEAETSPEMLIARAAAKVIQENEDPLQGDVLQRTAAETLYASGAPDAGARDAEASGPARAAHALPPDPHIDLLRMNGFIDAPGEEQFLHYIDEMLAAEIPELVRAGQRFEYFDDRFYRRVFDDGRPAMFYPSVTTIIGGGYSPLWLAPWRESVGSEEANRRMRTAGDRGSRIHHAIYTLLRGGLVIYQPYKFALYDEGKMRGFAEYFNGNVFELRDQDEMLHVDRVDVLLNMLAPRLLAAEMSLFSDAAQYAGTLDFLWDQDSFRYNGVTIPAGRYIVDIKTGNLSETHGMQLAAYTIAAEEHGLHIDGALIIYTGKGGTRAEIPGLGIKYLARPELQAEYEQFQHVKAIYHKKMGAAPQPRIEKFRTLITRIKV